MADPSGAELERPPQDTWEHTPQRVTQQFHDLLNDKDLGVQKLVKRYLWGHFCHRYHNLESVFTIDYNKWCPTGTQSMFEYLQQLDQLNNAQFTEVSALVKMYLLGWCGGWKGDLFIIEYQSWRSHEKRSMLFYLQEISLRDQPWSAGAISALTNWEHDGKYTYKLYYEMYCEMYCDGDVADDS